MGQSKELNLYSKESQPIVLDDQKLSQRYNDPSNKTLLVAPGAKGVALSAREGLR